MRLDEYAAQDAVGLAELVARGDVTARELAELAGRAMEDVDPRLNAVVHDLRDRAFRRLEDPGEDAGAARPFAGVPFLAKDNLEIEGTRVTFGSALTQGFIAARTHPVARALEGDAGLVVLGRTNMCELGLLPTTEPLLYPATKNPWDLRRSPGGSSGGAAAAVAAGIVPMAHGNDGGGSIRIPASACGVFGLKPSAGRAPATVADHPSGFICELGITRSVRDAATLLDVVSTAPGDFAGWRRPPSPERPYAQLAREDPPAPLRIGVIDRDFHGRPAHEDCRAAVAAAAWLLDDLGHRVDDDAGPAIDGAAYDEAFLTLWSMSVGYVMAVAREAVARRARKLPAPIRWLLTTDMGVWLALRARAGRAPLEPLTRKLLREERRRSPGDVWLAWRGLNDASAALDAFFGSYDLLVTPTLGEPPWPLGALDPGASAAELQERLQRYAPFTPIANTSGAPAMSVPLYWNAAGLPIGVQVVAPWGREDRLVALAGQLERARPWGDRRPRVAV